MFNINNQMKLSAIKIKTNLDDYMTSELVRVSGVSKPKLFNTINDILKLSRVINPSDFAPKVSFSLFSNSDLQLLSHACRVNVSQMDANKSYENNYEDAVFGQYAACYMNWQLTKRIYSFNDLILAELLTTNMNLEIPANVILQLPDYSIYVNCPIESDTMACGGFYATLTNNITFSGEVIPCVEFIWTIVQTNKNPECHSMVIELDENRTLSAALESIFEKAKDYKQRNNTDDSNLHCIKTEISTFNFKLLSVFINCLLYLCQPEVDYKGGQPKCYVRNRVKLGMKIEPAKKITNVIVGEAAGKQLREARVVAEREFKEGKRKSPHLRRGHFHHYWILDADNEGQAKLIVKWLNPIMVNGTI